MSFEGKEFYNYAGHMYKEVLQFPIDKQDLLQPAYRTIINRSYYGAFTEAREYLKIMDEGISAHGSVSSAFKRENRQVGNNLSDLLKKRKEADYKIRKSFCAKDASDSLRLSKKILNYIDAQ